MNSNQRNIFLAASNSIFKTVRTFCAKCCEWLQLYNLHKKCRKQPWTGHFLRVWVSDCYRFTRSRIVQKIKINPISYRNCLAVGSCPSVSDYWSDLQLPIFCCLVEFSIWFSIKPLIVKGYENLAVWNVWEDRTEKTKKVGKISSKKMWVKENTCRPGFGCWSGRWCKPTPG